MVNQPIKGLLDTYYKAIPGKSRLEQLLSEDFSFSGALADSGAGRDAFVNSLFFRYIESLEVRSMIVEGGQACALVNYRFVSPKGDILSLDAAEIWKMKNGKLGSLSMFFDTAAYQKFMLPILFPLVQFKKKKPRI